MGLGDGLRGHEHFHPSQRGVELGGVETALEGEGQCGLDIAEDRRRPARGQIGDDGVTEGDELLGREVVEGLDLSVGLQALEGRADVADGVAFGFGRLGVEPGQGLQGHGGGGLGGDVGAPVG